MSYVACDDACMMFRQTFEYADIMTCLFSIMNVVFYIRLGNRETAESADNLLDTKCDTHSIIHTFIVYFFYSVPRHILYAHKYTRRANIRCRWFTKNIIYQNNDDSNLPRDVSRSSFIIKIKRDIFRLSMQ